MVSFGDEQWSAHPHDARAWRRTLDEAWILVPTRGEVGGERRRLDIGKLDDGAFGLGHDLRRHDDDVAVDQRHVAGDEGGEVVSGGDLRQAAYPTMRISPSGDIPVHWADRSTATGSRQQNWRRSSSSANGVSDLFDPSRWEAVPGYEFTDITYHRAIDQGTVRIAFDRPEVRNAFRPHTVDELYAALDHARTSSDVGVVLLTGNGPSSRDGGWAFCSGGDQRIRGKDGYRYASGDDAGSIDPARPVACTSSSASG